MYSSEIEAQLQRNKISIGDTVKVICKKGTFEGVLMPRPETGNNNSLIIKRKDGYNIGIRHEKGMRIEKLSSGSSHFSFPRAKLKEGRNLPRLALLYTGGTIGSKVDYTTGGVYMLTKPEELLYQVPELSDIANLDVQNLMSISSEDMTYVEWKGIADAISKAFHGKAKGVMITMGTDTMHYTAAALSFMLQNPNGPVVITGAQRSSDRGSSDAFFNLVCSAQIAAKSDIGEVGICMHESSSDDYCSFIRGTKARKMHTSRRDAFRAVNERPIARVNMAGEMEYTNSYSKTTPAKRMEVFDKFEPRTALVKSYPNSDPGIIDYYVGKGAKGIIIEGTGLGHVPTAPSLKEYSWTDRIKSAIESGVIIGITSQTIYGRVSPTVYRNARLLAAMGAVYCEDMTPETAYVKLGFLLGNHGAKKARELLNVNMVGEISQRTEFDTFPVE